MSDLDALVERITPRLVHKFGLAPIVLNVHKAAVREELAPLVERAGWWEMTRDANVNLQRKLEQAERERDNLRAAYKASESVLDKTEERWQEDQDRLAEAERERDEALGELSEWNMARSAEADRLAALEADVRLMIDDGYDVPNRIWERLDATDEGSGDAD